jgi:hypothetical protein
MGVLSRAAGWLAAHRTPVYLAGLGVVAGARYRPGPLGGSLSPATAGWVVAVALALMVATYLAELAAGDGSADASGYSRRARLLVGLGLAGFAVGGWFALDGRPLVGAPFLLGAVLLVRAGVRRPATDDGEGVSG